MKYSILSSAVVAALSLLNVASASALTINAPYSSQYSAANIGAAPGAPAIYAGVAINPADPTKLYIAGNAFSAGGNIYAATVTRDFSGHINGFSGTASIYSSAPNISNGGLAFGPGSVLLYTAGNNIGEIKPGSSAPDRVITAPVGTADISLGTLGFDPASNRLVVTSYLGSTWFDTTLSPDGNGTYDINPTGYSQFFGGRPLGLYFPTTTAPDFSTPSVLIPSKGTVNIGAFQLDADRHVISASEVDFASINGMEGATVDPLTGDMLLVEYDTTDSPHIEVIQGFVAPEPASLSLLAAGSLLLIRRRRA